MGDVRKGVCVWEGRRGMRQRERGEEVTWRFWSWRVARTLPPPLQPSGVEESKRSKSERAESRTLSTEC
eukprot:3937700-Rhodomonas_salina.1